MMRCAVSVSAMGFFQSTVANGAGHLAQSLSNVVSKIDGVDSQAAGIGVKCRKPFGADLAALADAPFIDNPRRRLRPAAK